MMELGIARVTKSASVDSEQQQLMVTDRLECALCRRRFVDPRMLPCMHTFCRACLAPLCQQQAASGGRLHCPTCGRLALTSGGQASDLPPNNFISNILDVVISQDDDDLHHYRQQVQDEPSPSHLQLYDDVRRLASCFERLGGQPLALGQAFAPGSSLISSDDVIVASPRCASCDGSVTSARCVDCAENLCDGCVTAHQRVRLTKTHRIVYERLSPQHLHQQQLHYATGSDSSGTSSPLGGGFGAMLLAKNQFNRQFHQSSPASEVIERHSASPVTLTRTSPITSLPSQFLIGPDDYSRPPPSTSISPVFLQQQQLLLKQQQQQLSNSLSTQHQQQRQSCEVHIQQVVSLFCDTCSKPICQECSFIGAHASHTIISLSVALERARSLTVRLIIEAGGAVRALDDARAAAQATGERVETRAQAVAAEIRATTRRYITAVEERERELLRRLDKARLAKIKSLQQQVTDLGLEQARLTETLRATHGALTGGSIADVVRNRDVVISSLLACRQRLQGYLQPCDDESIVFFQPDTSLLTSVSQMGVMMTGTCAATCVAVGEGLKWAVPGKPAYFVIQAVDHQGEPLSKGGDSFDVTITPAGGSSKKVSLIY